MTEPYDPYSTPPEPRQDGPQGGYPAAQPYGQVQPARTAMATSAMVFGIVGFALSWFPLVGFLGLTGLILGAVVLTASRPGRGRAIAGTILGGIAVILFPVILALL